MSCFLKMGSKGEKVRILQDRLRLLGYYTRKVDGDYGVYTKEAVIKYQRRNKLIVDGCVGDQTWNKLFPKVTPNPAKQPTIVASDKNDVLSRIAIAIGGKFNNFTEFANILGKNEIYSKYNNDIYTQADAIERLRKGLGLNCADFSQIGYYVAKTLGYDVKYAHIRCKSGGGHIVLYVKGKELGSNWVVVDLASMASVGSKYKIGQYWCSNGKIESWDDEWLMSDDGRT